MVWTRTHIGIERDDGLVGGLPVWKHQWRRLGGSVFLPPDAGEAANEFMLYEIGGAGWPVQVRFAAREMSNNVWAFWEEVAETQA